MIGSRRSLCDALLRTAGIEGLLECDKKVMGMNLDSGATMDKGGATHGGFQSLVFVSLEHRLLHPALLIVPDHVVLGWSHKMHV